MKHTELIPGLDRFLCGKCRKWICHPCEIERLQKQLDNAKQKNTKEALYIELDKEKRLAKDCR